MLTLTAPAKRSLGTSFVLDDAMEFKAPGTRNRFSLSTEELLLREEREIITALGTYFTIPRTRITVAGTDVARYYEGTSTDNTVAVTVHVSLYPTPQVVASVYWNVQDQERYVMARQPNLLIVESLEKAFLLRHAQSILDGNYTWATHMSPTPLVLRAFLDSRDQQLKVSVSTHDRLVRLVASLDNASVALNSTTGNTEITPEVRSQLHFIAPILEQALSAGM